MTEIIIVASFIFKDTVHVVLKNGTILQLDTKESITPSDWVWKYKAEI
jgi:hypothetical protein